jgi:5-methylcytosine-specific restriction enzyme subunit McrC
MPRIISIRENSRIAEGIRGTLENGTTEVDLESFNQLSDFIEANQSNSLADNAFSQFRRNKRRYIGTKNYVGVVQTKNGTVFEILPKIFKNGGQEEISLADAKIIVLRMLATLKDSPFLALANAGLESSKSMPLLEVFIKEYLDELEILLSKELRGGYQLQRGENVFVKGKLLVSEQIKKFNVGRIEFSCEYDVFSKDVSPNRLIKSTLLKLGRISQDTANGIRIRKHLENFSDISPAHDLTADFSYCEHHGYLLKNYRKILSWANVILQNQGFHNFAGETVNLALLFPMEKLFESYVSYVLKRYGRDIDVRVQDRRFFLVSDITGIEPVKQFQLRPDLVLLDNKVIIDTKWKLIDDTRSNFNISEKDIYQMHAYGRRYQREQLDSSPPRLYLLYPANHSREVNLPKYTFGEDLNLTVLTFDLNAKDQQIETLKLIDQIA